MTFLVEDLVCFWALFLPYLHSVWSVWTVWTQEWSEIEGNSTTGSGRSKYGAFYTKSIQNWLGCFLQLLYRSQAWPLGSILSILFVSMNSMDGRKTELSSDYHESISQQGYQCLRLDGYFLAASKRSYGLQSCRMLLAILGFANLTSEVAVVISFWLQITFEASSNHSENWLKKRRFHI